MIEVSCQFKWEGPDLRWVQHTFCDDGICDPPTHDGTYIGQPATVPCGVPAPPGGRKRRK